MKNIVLILSVLMFSVLGSCSSQKYHTTRIQSKDFTQYKTYGWLAPVDSLSKDYYNNDIAKDNILRTANQELEARGLTYAKENPDILFRYVAIVNNKSRIVYSSPMWGGWGPWGMGFRPWGWGWSPWGMGFGGFSHPVGKERVRYSHIIIEALDRRTNTVVWQARGTGEVDVPEKAINNLPKVISGVMREYPVNKKK